MANISRAQKSAALLRASRLSRSRQFGYSALCILLVLLLCEAAVRTRAWLRYGTSNSDFADEMFVVDPDSGLRCPRPGYVRSSQKVSIEINSLGFRGDEITPQKPPGTLRIACLGASTTFCGEVSNNHATWPHQLQEALQKRYPDISVEVVNAGVPGYVAAESLRNLERRVLPLQPDLVIYYEANNDIALDTRDLARRRGLIPPSSGYMSRRVKLLSQGSLLFDLVYKNVSIILGSRDTSVGRFESIPADLPTHFIDELDKMQATLQSNGIPFVLSTFLVKYRRNQDRATQIRNANVSFYYMPWMTIDGLLDSMDLYNRAIVDYAHSHGVPVVEERDSIPADSEHYADWAHMTDAGARQMAQRFEHFLTTTGIVDQIVSAKIRKPTHP